MVQYKVGDYVIIKKREGNAEDYPFSFISDMAELAGNKYEIATIEEASITGTKRKYYNGDNHSYYLKNIGGKCIKYTWHSSMFEDRTAVGDSIIVAEYKGIIKEQYTRHTFYVQFGAHAITCTIINELPYTKDLVREFHGTDETCCFPEFKTLKDLLGFIEKLNSLYKGEKEDKQTIKTSQNYEIGLQKPKASLDGGGIRRRSTISFERCKARIV